jgi:uncharacterized protein YaaQ
MKLMIVILSDSDAETALHSLIELDFRVTRVASTGGFLRRGNTTLLIGTAGERVDEAMEVILKSCSEPEQKGQRRATIFVLNVQHYEQL